MYKRWKFLGSQKNALVKEIPRISIFLGLIFLLVLSSCQLNAPDKGLNGRITIWHSWSTEETVILNETLTQFQEIHPNVHISSIAFPYDQILAEFMEAGKEGLGPTLIFGTDSWIGDLVDAGLIRPLPPDLAKLELFNERNLALTKYRGHQYGLPLVLAPRALYYNKSLVSEPPETLDDLLQEAEAGRSVAFVPRFTEAYWGIQAFGEGLFDDQVRFTLAESGFSEWLAWLNEAQGAPGVILNVDDQSLLDLFASGQVAYYVARPDAQALIDAEMDEERRFEIGIAPLPGRTDASGGPLLPAEVIMLYRFNSPEEMAIVNELAAYLVNQQQSIRFLRELDRVPANPSVRVDKRIYPNVHGFAQQSHTAVVIPNEIVADPLVEAGNRAYANVLSGALTLEEAICNFGREVAKFQGYAQSNISLPEGCKLIDSDE
jgi:arabinogalactan oligomer/maltooligosaccharide transport system substrate-binding protein